AWAAWTIPYRSALGAWWRASVDTGPPGRPCNSIERFAGSENAGIRLRKSTNRVVRSGADIGSRSPRYSVQDQPWAAPISRDIGAGRSLIIAAMQMPSLLYLMTSPRYVSSGTCTEA